MPRSMVLFPKALFCCCLQNDDLSVTAAVMDVGFFFLLLTGLAKWFGFQRRKPLLLAAAHASTLRWELPPRTGGGD